MLHTNLPIYKKVYDLLSLAGDVQLNMPRSFKQSLGKRVHDRALLANALRDRGHSIKSDLKKTYRTKASRA